MPTRYRAATRAVEAFKKGNQVVAVASARGQQTDELIADAMELNPNPPRREMDMLLSTGEQQTVSLFAMALDAMGQKAISFNGSQIRMLTDGVHTRARIISIDADVIRRKLDTGHIVIVAGFQGVDAEQDITTLGRGGSDTSAVALAAALKADVCEIYTDVDGIYTSDPRSSRPSRWPVSATTKCSNWPASPRHAQPLHRVWQEIWRANTRPQQLEQ